MDFCSSPMASISAIRALPWASAIARPFWLERDSMVLRLNMARAIMTSKTITEMVAIKANPDLTAEFRSSFEPTLKRRCMDAVEWVKFIIGYTKLLKYVM